MPCQARDSNKHSGGGGGGGIGAQVHYEQTVREQRVRPCGAVTALSLSEQEVANLRTVVKELKDRPPEGANAVVTREREQLRAAGHARCCPPRHQKLLQPSSPELHSIL